MTITTYKCPSCSAPLPYTDGSVTIVCPYCGTVSRFDNSPENLSTVTVTPPPPPQVISESKSWWTTLFLAVTTGMFGGHRYYTGHIGSAVIQSLTIGGFYVWWFADIIMILTNSFTDSKGRPLDKNKPANLKLVIVIGIFWLLFWVGLLTSNFTGGN